VLQSLSSRWLVTPPLDVPIIKQSTALANRARRSLRRFPPQNSRGDFHIRRNLSALLPSGVTQLFLIEKRFGAVDPRSLLEFPRQQPIASRAQNGISIEGLKGSSLDTVRIDEANEGSEREEGEGRFRKSRSESKMG
jgi:hypothetical protein